MEKFLEKTRVRIWALEGVLRTYTDVKTGTAQASTVYRDSSSRFVNHIRSVNATLEVVPRVHARYMHDPWLLHVSSFKLQDVSTQTFDLADA